MAWLRPTVELKCPRIGIATVAVGTSVPSSGAAQSWHDQRAVTWEQVLRCAPGPPTVGRVPSWRGGTPRSTTAPFGSSIPSGGEATLHFTIEIPGVGARQDARGPHKIPR